MRNATWVDSDANPDVDYEYRLIDEQTGDTSTPVEAEAMGLPDDPSAVASVSRVQSVTRPSPCGFDQQLCPPDPVLKGGLAMRGGAAAVERDRGVFISAPARSQFLSKLESRQCDAGGTVATARSRAVSVGRVEGSPRVLTPTIEVARGALLEQAGEVVRVRVSGPLTVLRVGQEGTTSHDNPVPYVSVVVTTPNGEELASVSPVATNNGVDETWESGPWWEYSFPGQTRYGWVPAGSTIRVRALFYPQYSTPWDAWVNPQTLSVARPGGCAPAISRDGTRAVVHDGRSLIEFDTETGERRRTVCEDCGGPGFPVHPAYDADDRSVLFALDGVIHRAKPSADTEVALALPDGEFATDPVVLADGSLAVLGERGVWVNEPAGLRLAAPGAGGVGVDGAGRLLAAKRTPNLVHARDNPPQSGGQFFDVERNRPVASVPGAEHLFAGPGAGGARTRLTVFESQQAVSFRDYGISASGANLGFLPVISGPSEGLYGAPQESTFYRAFSSSRTLRPSAPVVVAPRAANGGDVPVEIAGASPAGIRAARAVLAGRAAQVEACSDACPGPVGKTVVLNVDGLAEGSYRVAGAVKDGRGGYSFTREPFKLDRTAPEASDPPVLRALRDGELQVTWPSMHDPQLADGSEGSGAVRLRVRSADLSGEPAGAWADWSTGASQISTSAGVVQVQAVDGAGNLSQTVSAKRASVVAQDPSLPTRCKPLTDAKARARLHLGLSLEPQAPQGIAAGVSGSDPFLRAKAIAFEAAWTCFGRVMNPAPPKSKKARVPAQRLPDLRFMVPIDVMARSPSETAHGKPELWGPRKQLSEFFDLLKKRTQGAERKRATVKWPRVVISTMSHDMTQCVPKPESHPSEDPPRNRIPTERRLDGHGVAALGSCGYPDLPLYREYFRLLVEYTLESLPKGFPRRNIHWTAWNEPTNQMFTLRYRQPAAPCGEPGFATPVQSSICWSAMYWVAARGVLRKNRVLQAARFTSADLSLALPAFEPPDTSTQATLERARIFQRALTAHGYGRAVAAWALHPYIEFAPKSANRRVIAGFAKADKKREIRRILVTESGALLSDPNRQPSYATRERQAEAGQGVRLSTKNPGGPAVFWFYYSMGGPRVGDAGDRFDSALVDSSGAFRPVLCGIAGLPAIQCSGSILPTNGHSNPVEP